ncbi:hypothetical protein DUI87_11732 [Hirundo rustica rustica]|uniref:Uncharacterized protein n=1 Tax=Hirundo rustica rustica TaxID=333673 RepID=A0A3M0KG87_HIRRU|nr:hypothetical protein DUI87_11732 [Hirundo rustica rustica]
MPAFDPPKLDGYTMQWSELFFTNESQRNVQGCFLDIALSHTQRNKGWLLPMQALAWRNGVMRSEGSRQQELLTLRGKHTPTPQECGDKAWELGEDEKRLGKERDRDAREARGYGLPCAPPLLKNHEDEETKAAMWSRLPTNISKSLP